MSFPKKCIIVDIGSERIKLVDVIRNKKEIKVMRSSIVECPKGSIDDGMIVDMEAVSEAVKKGLLDLRSRCKDIVFVIASSKVITREVNFPDVSNKKLKSIVEMNAGEYFPVNLDEYIVDFNIVERTENRGEKVVAVTIVAALSSLVNQYVFLAKECSLNLAGIDYSGNSLGNFAKHESFEGANIVVDIGSSGTMVNIVDNGIIKFSRNLLYGSNAIMEAIAESFDVDYEEAINISKDRPLLNTSNEENPFLKNDVSDAMNDVLNGVSRLVDYYTSRNEIKFDKIILVGGGSTIYGLKDYVETYFSIDAMVVDDIKCVSLSSDQLFLRDAIFFANVMGACYSQINLLPKKVSEKVAAKASFKFDILVVLLVVLLLGVISFLKVFSINNLRSEKENLEAQLIESQKIIAIKEEWIKLKEQAEFRHNLIEESSDISELLVSIIDNMEETMPTEVYVKSIIDTGEEIAMACTSKDKMTMAKFVESLRNLDEYKFLDISVPTATEVKVVPEDLIEGVAYEDLLYDDKYFEFSVILAY